MVERLALRSSGDPPWWIQCLFTIKTGASRPLLEKNYLVPEKLLMLSWLRHLNRSLGVGSTWQWRFQASLWYFLLLWPLEAAQTSCPIGYGKAEISFSWLFKTISNLSFLHHFTHTHTHKTPLFLWQSCCKLPPCAPLLMATFCISRLLWYIFCLEQEIESPSQRQKNVRLVYLSLSPKQCRFSAPSNTLGG